MTKQNLMLIPGLICDKTVWEYQLSHLSDVANIIVPDLSSASTPEAMVSAALANAPEQFALAGHSMGGWVALEMMRQHAHRVSKLCLVNTTALLDSPAKAAVRHQLIQLAHQHQSDEIIEKLMKAFYYQPHIKTALRKMLERNINSLANQENAMLMRKDCVPLLQTIRCPTLIIHANQDDVFHLEDCELLHKGIVGSMLANIDACGHMSPMEATEEVTRLMKSWLA